MKLLNSIPTRNLSASLLAAAIVSLGLCFGATTSSAEPEVLLYDFDDGTFQGWTNVITVDDPTQYWAVVSGGAGSRGWPQAGTHRVLPEPHDSRNVAHDTLWLRSPEFQLSDHAPLSFYLLGGWSPALPDNAADVPLTSSSGGSMGMALRRVSDGDFVLTGTRSSNSDTSWQKIEWTPEELAPYAGDVFTLDLIDYRDGGWAFIHLDTVSVGVVPEPASAALMFGGLVAGLVLLRRRMR